MKRRERYSIRSFLSCREEKEEEYKEEYKEEEIRTRSPPGVVCWGVPVVVVVVVVVAFRTCFGFDALSPIACVAFVFFIRLNCTELTALKTGFCPSVSSGT